MKIILISGKAEAGKTTTARYLKEKLEAENYKVVIASYGQYVKDTAKMLWGWNGQKDKTGRQLLQWWGTDVVRTQVPSFWVDSVIRLACIVQEYVDYFIVDDCRFKNEIELWQNDLRTQCIVKDWDLMTIRVNRPEHENALTPEQRQHPSETELDDYMFDITINAPDLAELEYAICEQVLPKLLNETMNEEKNLVINVCEAFDDFLYERGIMIPNDDREGDPDEAAIYGSDWDDIMNRVKKLLEG